ncbi:T9SS type A sorting domain-containing protein [Brumimicrobium mesophilum]|uniref:T9SS type A sorting domain-containing protein n=1 Tax=Brumimicrobium mesophilum TaxID=392717 RepID=UPI000D1437CD|nr:T9SS type A sorting domain-containing protein [Brumimicrobium mesophilum]
MKKLLLLKFLILFSLISSAQCLETLTFGGMHTLGQKSDGTLWGWGAAAYGNLETITIVEPNPIQVGTETDWDVVKAGKLNTFAIKDGTLWGAGSNQYGSLGVNSATQQFHSFQQVGTATNWMDVYPNSDFTLAIKTDGTLWAWGRNDYNQMGNSPNTADQLFPIQIGSDTDWVSAAGFHRTSFALKSNGTIWGWGSNISSVIEASSSTNLVLEPTQIGTTTDWVKMSIGLQHVLAQKSDGTLWSWGGGAGLGVGGSPTETNTPQQISTDKWSWFSAGGNTSYAIKEDGTLWVWGINSFGRLGDGTDINRFVPYQIGTENNWETVNAGFANAIMATKSDGTIWYWGGRNQYGEYGNGESFGATFILSPVMTDGICVDLTELGLDGNEKVDEIFSVFPNPAKDIITVQYELSSSDAELEIYDISGRSIINQSLRNYEGETKINTSRFHSGVYVIVFKRSNGGVWQQKIVIE